MRLGDAVDFDTQNGTIYVISKKAK